MGWNVEYPVRTAESLKAISALAAWGWGGKSGDHSSASNGGVSSSRIHTGASSSSCASLDRESTAQPPRLRRADIVNIQQLSMI